MDQKPIGISAVETQDKENSLHLVMLGRGYVHHKMQERVYFHILNHNKLQ